MVDALYKSIDGKSYCSTQVNLPPEIAEVVRGIAYRISPVDLHPIEKNGDDIHITVRYGLHDEDPSGVRELVEGIGPVEASITGVDVFRPEGKDYDVLVMTVDSPDLCALNQGLGVLPHTDTFSVYRPHSTIAYLVRGAGDEYKTMVTGLEGKVVTFKTLQFSNKGEKKTPVSLSRDIEPLLEHGELEKSDTEKSQFQNIMDDFVPFCVKYLKLKDVPEIKFIGVDKAKEIKAFGQHHQDKNKPILLDVESRHPMDILRTLAHELVHHEQDTQGGESSGATSVTYRGNKKENEANKIAGILVRNYAVGHPDYFGLGAVKKSEGHLIKCYVILTKSKLEYVPAGPGHKAYTRTDPREKHESGKLQIESLKQIGPQLGSQPGGLYEDKTTGKKWYVKMPHTDEHGRNEKLTADLYHVAGINVPTIKMTENGFIASEWIEGLHQDLGTLQNDKPKGLAEGFAADCWLANHDVVGTAWDNILLDKTGEAIRVDTGGGLLYRARGGPKNMDDKVPEWDGMRTRYHPAAEVFGKLTKRDLIASGHRVISIPDTEIRRVVGENGFGNDLAELLIKRKNVIAGKVRMLEDEV